MLMLPLLLTPYSEKVVDTFADHVGAYYCAHLYRKIEVIIVIGLLWNFP